MAEDVDDETLMLRYVQGDASAFAVLYGRYKRRLYRFCLRMVMDPGRAEEVFQDAWMRLIESRQRYRVEARFVTFLYQIARNRTIDVLRKDGRVAFSLDDEGAEPVAASLKSADTDEPHRAFERRREGDRVRAAVEGLPFPQREAFLLHEEGELTLDEIAALTGVGRETVKSRIRYALAKLRLELEEASDG